MKKFILGLLLAGVGYAIWNRYQQVSLERDLWSDVTDSIS